MADFVTLTCSSCGAKLQVTNDIDRFACAYCGNEHIVKRKGGIISLTPVIEGLQKIQTGVDKTASELAITRLKREVQELEKEIRASANYIKLNEKYPNSWLGKNIDTFTLERIASDLETDLLDFKEHLSKGGVLVTLLRPLFGRIANKTLQKYQNDVEELLRLYNSFKDKQSQLKKHEQLVR